MSDFLTKIPQNELVEPKVGMEEMTIPFLKILQTLSPQCNKDSDEYIKGAETGMFYNSVTNKVYGKNIHLIPVYFEKSWLEYKPDRGGFVGRHLPEAIDVDKSDYSKWRTQDGNIIVESYNFFCLLNNYPEEGIVVFPMTSSAIKQAKLWNTLIKGVRLGTGLPAPYFSSVWELETRLVKNDKGSWYNPSSITKLGFIEEIVYNSYIKATLTTLNETMNKIDYNQVKGIEEPKEY